MSANLQASEIRCFPVVAPHVLSLVGDELCPAGSWFDAKADAVIDFAKRVKDWPMLAPHAASRTTSAYEALPALHAPGALDALVVWEAA